MDELKKNIETILNQFALDNGIGIPAFGVPNRIDQFAFLSLKSMIMNELNKPIKEKEDA